MSEFDYGLNMMSSSAESLEDFLDIGAILHWDDSQLILLVDPHEECLCIIVEDASARWPISVQAARLKESITLPIEI